MNAGRLRFCERHSELMSDLHDATLCYAAAIRDLVLLGERLTRYDYGTLLRGAGNARVKLNAAREAWSDRRRDHGC